MQGNYGIFVRAKDGEIIGRVNDVSSIRILATLNDIGSWSITSRTTDPCPFEPGMGIVVVRNSEFLYGGILQKIQDRLDAKTKLYSWNVSGIGDLGYLNRRICYVDTATGSTTTRSHYTDSGRLSLVVNRLIERNLGSQALEPRIEPIITLKDYSVIGGNVSVSLRFQNLLKSIVSLVRSNGYNIKPCWDKTVSKVYYEVFAGRNLSQEIIFTDYLNNIIESEFDANVPEANYILAGGTGEMTERQFSVASNEFSAEQWGRIEVFQDARSQNDVSSYALSVLDRKSENTIGYSCVASDSDNSPQFGIDYELGDIISMRVGNTYVAAEVQQVEINVNGGKESISPKFGTIAVGKFREIFSQITSIRENLDELLGKEID